MVNATAPRRAGFTLVEVIVSLLVLAVALLGLAAVSTLAATTMHRSLAQERAARHAAALLDSLTFTAGAGAGDAIVEGIRYQWSAEPGAGGAIRITAGFPGAAAHLVELDGARIVVPAGGAP